MASESDADSTGWSAKLYNMHADFVYSKKFTAPILGMLNPQRGETIIDFGCGSGELTKQIEEVVKSEVGGLIVGVDLSVNMITAAKGKGLEHMYVADIQDLPDLRLAGAPDVKYDAVFTNATLHWCKRDPKGILKSVKRVLKPDGRFVGEMGGFMNLVGVRSVLHHILIRRGYKPSVMDPFYFPSVEDYTTLLNSESFEPLEVTLVPRFNPLPTDLIGWQRTFVRGSFLKDMSDDEAESIMAEVQDICTPDCKDSQGNWSVMYMRLRFCAVWKEKDVK